LEMPKSRKAREPMKRSDQNRYSWSTKSTEVIHTPRWLLGSALISEMRHSLADLSAPLVLRWIEIETPNSRRAREAERLKWLLLKYKVGRSTMDVKNSITKWSAQESPPIWRLLIWQFCFFPGLCSDILPPMCCTSLLENLFAWVESAAFFLFNLSISLFAAYRPSSDDFNFSASSCRAWDSSWAAALTSETSAVSFSISF
jgi:hypothetical protein